MAAAEHFREQLAKALVHSVERFFEARAGFAVDPADRVAERLERLDQIAVLLIQILFALRRRLVLFDRREVDRAEPLDAVRYAFELFRPRGLGRLGRQRFPYGRERQAGRFQLFDQGSAPHVQSLAVDARRFERGADAFDRFGVLAAPRLEFAHLQIGRLERAPHVGQLVLHRQALRELAVEFAAQIRQRRLARFDAGGQLAMPIREFLLLAQQPLPRGLRRVEPGHEVLLLAVQRVKAVAVGARLLSRLFHRLHVRFARRRQRRAIGFESFTGALGLDEPFAGGLQATRFVLPPAVRCRPPRGAGVRDARRLLRAARDARRGRRAVGRAFATAH